MVRQATGDRRQRFHLDPGRPGYLDGRAHAQAGTRAVRLDVDRNFRNGEGMAERDQLMRALGRHDAGDAGSAQHVTFLGIAREHEVERLRRHHHAALGDSHALGRGFRRHVHHACLAALAQMAQLGRHRLLRGTVLRIAASIAADERARGSFDVVLAHQAFAHQEGGDAYLRQICEISARENPALANQRYGPREFSAPGVGWWQAWSRRSSGCGC